MGTDDPLDGRSGRQWRGIIMRGTAMAIVGLTVLAGGTILSPAPATAAHPGHRTATVSTARTTDATSWTYRKLTAPSRVQVLDARSTLLATFTVGARTVTVRGATRVFAEPTTAHTVTSSTWVRLLPAPFGGTVDTAWLRRALADTSPDILATAAQYVTGAPTQRTGTGAVLAGDADYGPLRPDGSRSEGSDFNDYLGASWSYGATTDQPEADEAGALDCSGFVRMVFGYRTNVAMTLGPDGIRLPRRSPHMLSSAPGVVTVRDTGARPVSTTGLAPGDLLFFDGSTDDGALIDHVGIYLGVDSSGAPRFVSSRKIANGPTMGDVGGKSVLSGTGYYAQAWRAARRL
jgi:cell wall-associated NlpC family hydrolase